MHRAQESAAHRTRRGDRGIWSQLALGLIAPTIGCAPDTLTLPLVAEPDTLVAVVALDATDQIVDVTSGPGGAEPLRRTITDEAVRFVVMSLPAPLDPGGATLSAPTVGRARGCACTIPVPAGAPLLAPGDECPIPVDRRAHVYDRGGVEAADEGTIAAVVAELAVARDGECRRPLGEHMFASRVERCDVSPAPYADALGIDGAGRVLAMSRTGQTALFDGARLHQRWSGPPLPVVRGLRGGGFLLAGLVDERPVATHVGIDGGTVTREAATIEGAFVRFDSSAIDGPSGDPLLIGRNELDGTLVAQCRGAPLRCAPITIPCNLRARSVVSVDADGALLALASESRLAWRAGSDWVCLDLALASADRWPYRAVVHDGAALLFAARADLTGGELYRTALPITAASRFERVGDFASVRDPLAYYLDSGEVWLIGDEAAVVVAADGAARAARIDEFPELGQLQPQATRTTDRWSVLRFASGHVAWRERGGPLRQLDRALPGGGPLLALEDGRALALDPLGPTLLDATGGCDTATISAAPSYTTWPAPLVAARRAGDERVLLAGDQPRPWVQWASLTSGALIGDQIEVSDARKWVGAAAFLPGVVALLDARGAVFVSRPGEVRPLAPVRDDPGTPETDSSDALGYDLVVACDGVAWVAGNGADALARVVSDGHGGFRMEAYWGRRAQLARSGETRPAAFWHRAVECLAANDIMITAEVRAPLVETIATARYRLLRDGTTRTTADTPGRISDGPALGWAGDPQHLYYLHPAQLELLVGDVTFPQPLVSFAETSPGGGTYLSFGGPSRRYSWVRPF